MHSTVYSNVLGMMCTELIQNFLNWECSLIHLHIISEWNPLTEQFVSFEGNISLYNAPLENIAYELKKTILVFHPASIMSSIKGCAQRQVSPSYRMVTLSHLTVNTTLN